MLKDEYVKVGYSKLEESVEHFHNDSLTDLDNFILKLLGEIIVVEKSSATPTVLYNQLKENYFHNDLATSDFLCRLYDYDINALDIYLDIYLEQVFEDDIENTKTTQKLNNMRTFLQNISDNLLVVFNQKIQNYIGDFKL